MGWRTSLYVGGVVLAIDVLILLIAFKRKPRNLSHLVCVEDWHDFNAVSALQNASDFLDAYENWESPIVEPTAIYPLPVGGVRITFTEDDKEAFAEFLDGGRIRVLLLENSLQPEIFYPVSYSGALCKIQQHFDHSLSLSK